VSAAGDFAGGGRGDSGRSSVLREPTTPLTLSMTRAAPLLPLLMTALKPLGTVRSHTAWIFLIDPAKTVIGLHRQMTGQRDRA